MSKVKIPRITLNYLKDWCNSEFKRLEITEYVVTSVVRAYHNQDQLEGGACSLIIRFKEVNGTAEGHFLGFYSIHEIKKHLNAGYKLALKFDRFGILTNTELDVTKI
jgi:hypothetical protein